MMTASLLLVIVVASAAILLPSHAEIEVLQKPIKRVMFRPLPPAEFLASQEFGDGWNRVWRRQRRFLQPDE